MLGSSLKSMSLISLPPLAQRLLPKTVNDVSVIADNAKPRAIVGRKATGPSGIAELPKQNKRDRVTLRKGKPGLSFFLVTLDSCLPSQDHHGELQLL
jgi:hypothetical protein